MTAKSNFWFILIAVAVAVPVVIYVVIQDDACTRSGGVLVDGVDGLPKCVNAIPSAR